MRDIGLTRGGVGLISGLTCDVGAGDCLFLRGRNGAGKTTLLRAMAGLTPVGSGTLTVDAPPAFSGHADGLKASLTVAENLEVWASLYGTVSIDAAVSAWALTPLLDRPAAVLSAGQKRRVGLARLLVTGCKLWLMDEPTTALDAGFVKDFEQVVRAHLAKGGAAVISTHLDLGVQGQTINLDEYRPDDAAVTLEDDWAGVM